MMDANLAYERQRYIDQTQQAWLVSKAVGHCLHVGCGEKRIIGAINIDPNPTRALWRDYDYDVHDLPFEDETFDSVVSSHVLPSLRDIKRAFNEMIRVLKVGGLMAHVIPDWTHAPRRCDPRKPWQFQHQGWYGPDDFRHFFDEHLAGRLTIVELAHFPDFEFSFRFEAIKL